MVAISVMLDVAFHSGRTATVSAADIATRLGLARRGMEPLLRGPRGGYRLGRNRRDIGLTEIIAVATADDVEPTDGPTGPLQTLVVDHVWNDLEQAATRHLATLTLDDLMRQAAAAGLRRPAAEPIVFAI
jgi:Rrf2 family iron-sulfur cluster assembly transcriptional regulator